MAQASQTECASIKPCEVTGGAYYALPPAGWDGQSALPITVFFHGYGATAKAMTEYRDLTQAFSDAGVLLILPDGVGKTWAHVGSPSQRRDELTFMDAVLADTRRRWPVDEKRVWASGFSQGGSMAWDIACYRGDEYTAFFPVAGAFWRPLPQRCPGGPVNLRHIHGLSDTVVPIRGRPIAGRFHQGDVNQAMTLLREGDGCPAEPPRIEQQNGLSCEVWDQCASGKELQLCLHDGGHMMPSGWVSDAVRWAETLVK